ncbi:MAG: RNA polymerase sigma factor [Bacteroidales bacterium]|nr:RNA polymerase sigma factor [Bacteroidales bacterium]
MTPQEYNRAVEEFADRIYRFVLKSMGDEERSRDIVQDCYEKLWINVEEIEFGKTRAWLFSTAHNAMIDIFRKEKRMVRDDKQLEDVHEDGYSDLNEILHACLAKLNESYRTVILLRDYEGYSYKEIGEITGQTESQVKINIYRARMAMRKMIGKPEMVV